MECPSCGSTNVHRASTAESLRLAIWHCDDCNTQFTTQTDRDDTHRSPAARLLILNVDDRPSALYARSRILRATGFAVADATTGKSAWRIALELRPNLILLDVHLPDADGRLLCRDMHAHHELRAIPIVLISATLRAHEAPDLAACGAAGYVREPVAPESLAATLRRVLAA
jgi:CheY-like chemotaxis protein